MAIPGYLKVQKEAKKAATSMKSAAATVERKAGGMLEEVTGVTPNSQSVEKAVKTAMTHIQAGKFKEAGAHIGVQVDRAVKQGGLDKVMEEAAMGALDAFGKLEDTAGKFSADNMRRSAKECRKHKNNSLMQAIAGVCNGIATLMENTGKSMINVTKALEENITKIYKAAFGISSNKSVER